MAQRPAFPVMFDMAFTENLRIYMIEGSEDMPHETLIIQLMQEQFIGIPLRNNPNSNWMFLSYQQLHGVRANESRYRFRALTAYLSIFVEALTQTLHLHTPRDNPEHNP